MLSKWIRKLMMSWRAMLVVLLIIVFAGLGLLSIVWKPIKTIMLFLASVVICAFISELLHWRDISNRVSRIDDLVFKGKYYKALEKCEKIQQKDLSKVTDTKMWEIYRKILKNKGKCFWRIGDKTGNQEMLIKSIECYEELLDYSSGYTQKEYAEIYFKLAFAYRLLGKINDNSENIIKAIEILSSASMSLTYEEAEIWYINVQSLLGSTYMVLSEYRDKSQNLNKAIYALMQAKEICVSKKKAKKFYDYDISISLGEAMANLIQTDAKDEYIPEAIKNLEDGIRFYSELLAKNPQKHFPKEYAFIQYTLGSAYFELSKIKDNSNNTIKAKFAYKEALGLYTQQYYPIIYGKIIKTLKNLEIAADA